MRYLQKIAHFTYIIASGKKLEATQEECFRFEKELEKVFTGKDELEGLGEWEVDPVTGKKDWVYNVNGIKDLKGFLDKGGAKGK